MKKLTLFACLVALSLCCKPVQAQQRLHIEPPSRGDPLTPMSSIPRETPAAARIDLLEVQREAAEISRIAQLIPADVESIKKGMLPKDVLQRLKRIEKLSKHLRSQLNP